ncbi:outer membrane protein assembly factor [Halopseudomonas oceani]|uniref:Translocation and assembly module subunit TamA n=1 Tax=Halopseudomonas oceani TaxID=1708783 RepID=A0A2P4EUU7_9GAMM|nr:autotransporter assembly complex family protein [Halopseudomonas oceani]POB03235.1 hypothetical protein C1949_11140 [Halopseudomonas oceani]GGE49803.1 outer membrane protein assembly factor [Halopseudomonas oceani]
MRRAFPLLFLVSAVSVAQAGVKVTVEPAKRSVRENIEAYIGPVEAGSRADMERQLRHIDEQATLAAQALGYYQSRNDLKVTGPEDAPLVELKVELGDPVRLDKVAVEVLGPGAGTESFQLGVEELLASGQVLNHGRYETLKSRINNRALRYGYFEGQYFKRQLRVDVEQGKADVDIQYSTGPRYSLGAVHFSETQFSDDLLARMVPFEAGTPYDADLVGKLNQDLLSSGYFNGVLVTAPLDRAAGEQVPVEVEITERDPHSLGFGGGYSTDVGARGKMTWDQHWINPQGHSRGASMELSLPRQQISAFYQVPLDNPITHNLRYFVGWQKEDIDDVQTHSLAVGAEVNKRLESGWQRSVGLRLQQEVFSLGDDSGTATMLIPSLVMQRAQSSGGIDPRRGYSLLLDVQGAKEGVLSSVDFARVMGQVKGLYTLFDNHRFLGRVALGAVATNDFSSIPPSLRFFAGGDQSIRGYDYQSLSPVDSTGETIGARYLIASSAEYQYEFIKSWRAATFVDYGNAVDSLMDPLKTSVGIGLRWVSPIGPIRFDLARSLSDPDVGFKIHFSMGPEL